MTRDEVLALAPTHPIRRALEAAERELRDDAPSARIVAAHDVASSGKRRSTPCVREGAGLDSLTEGRVFDLARATYPTAAIFAHVAFPLPAVSVPPKMRRFTVDLIVRVPLDGGGFDLEAWEAKSPKAVESRDFVLRWGAFKAAYGIRSRLFRAERGGLKEEA